MVFYNVYDDRETLLLTLEYKHPVPHDDLRADLIENENLPPSIRIIEVSPKS